MDKQSAPEIPNMIALLWRAEIIGPVDVERLLRDLESSPHLTVSDLLRRSGLVTERQLQSLNLADELLPHNSTDDWRPSV